MKSITIKGRQYTYKICFECGEDYSWEWTEFYDGKTRTHKYRKYCLFGPIIIEEIPMIAFKVGFNIENPRITKQDLRERLEKEVELLERADEIRRGELI